MSQLLFKFINALVRRVKGPTIQALETFQVGRYFGRDFPSVCVTLKVSESTDRITGAHHSLLCAESCTKDLCHHRTALPCSCCPQCGVDGIASIEGGLNHEVTVLVGVEFGDVVLIVDRVPDVDRLPNWSCSRSGFTVLVSERNRGSKAVRGKKIEEKRPMPPGSHYQCRSRSQPDAPRSSSEMAKDLKRKSSFAFGDSPNTSPAGRPALKCVLFCILSSSGMN